MPLFSWQLGWQYRIAVTGIISVSYVYVYGYEYGERSIVCFKLQPRFQVPNYLYSVPHLLTSRHHCLLLDGSSLRWFRWSSVIVSVIILRPCNYWSHSYLTAMIQSRNTKLYQQNVPVRLALWPLANCAYVRVMYGICECYCMSGIVRSMRQAAS